MMGDDDDRAEPRLALTFLLTRNLCGALATGAGLAGGLRSVPAHIPPATVPSLPADAATGTSACLPACTAEDTGVPTRRTNTLAHPHCVPTGGYPQVRVCMYGTCALAPQIRYIGSSSS